MTISDSANLVIAGTTVIALILAILGYNNWKRELIVNRKMDIAIRLHKTSIILERAFILARSPAGFGIKGEEDFTNEQKRNANLQRRLMYIVNALSEFDAVVLEADILGIEEVLTFKRQYSDKFYELRISLLKQNLSTISDEEDDRLTKIVYGYGEDEFASQVRSITASAEAVSRKYVV